MVIKQMLVMELMSVNLKILQPKVHQVLKSTAYQMMMRRMMKLKNLLLKVVKPNAAPAVVMDKMAQKIISELHV